MVLRAQALRGMLHEFYMPALRAQQEWGSADVAASEEFLGLLEKFNTILSEAVCSFADHREGWGTPVPHWVIYTGPAQGATPFM